MAAERIDAPMSNDRTASPALCAKSKRDDGEHSWRFDGDDPYIVCVFCDEVRDAINGRVIRAVIPRFEPAAPSPASVGPTVAEARTRLIVRSHGGPLSLDTTTTRLLFEQYERAVRAETEARYSRLVEAARAALVMLRTDPSEWTPDLREVVEGLANAINEVS